jgi:hypothetical protein
VVADAIGVKSPSGDCLSENQATDSLRAASKVAGTSALSGAGILTLQGEEDVKRQYLLDSAPPAAYLNGRQVAVDFISPWIARLQQHPDSESDVFVPLELGFQVQALAGEVQAGDDGEFSVRFFVNVGESSQAGHRVYIGGESVVTLKNLRVFLASLHEALAVWSRAHSVSPV